MAKALPLSDYFFEHLSAAVDTHSIDGRARLAERARPLLNRLPDSLYRDLMLQRLADLARIDKKHIEKRITVSTRKPADRGSINPTRTPVRLAIALLLNRPDLAQKVSDIDRFKKLSVPGLGLLLELVEMLQSHPHINSVALILTRYQGTEMERILTRLAQWKPEYAEKSYEKHAEDPYEKEFLGILEHLEKRYSPHQMLLENAILKGKLDELSAEERQLLKNISRTK